MKRIVQALTLTSTLIVPALALACPGASRAACGSQLFDHAGTLGAGIVVGALSVLVERVIRSRRT
ncbi:MAG: hypothetical protein JNL38_14445 [Myxococcales bacterium]|jgi:hypothetical protein|nr:hypothetical protein [Myxococcales bacterium]